MQPGQHGMMWSNEHQSDQDTTDAVRVAPPHSMLSWLDAPDRGGDRGLGLGRACARLVGIFYVYYSDNLIFFIINTSKYSDKLILFIINNKQ